MLDILLGIQWGDEGKGKIIDLIASDYDYVARFQGGPNAGHTIYINNNKIVLHQIPSGILHDGIISVIGNGVIINPIILLNEINELKKINIDVSNKLILSDKINLILPTHILLDKIAEETNKIGSTLKGITPTYRDKISRNGLLIKDLFNPNFKNILNEKLRKHLNYVNREWTIDLEREIDEWLFAVDELKKLNIEQTEILLNSELKKGKSILAEGAQGTMLDIDFGTYPYVTSSSTTSGGACIGLGIAPNKVNKIIGVFKAYTTRVGNGEFPTELNNEIGQKLRDVGHEYGSTTGRERRCGWLDLPLLKYACAINGVTELIMTKLDVLEHFDEIQLCHKYDKLNNPDYLTFNGWKNNLNNRNTYIDFIQSELETKITKISIGKERNDIINL